MEIIKKKLSELVSAPYNPRRITPFMLSKLKASLQEFGYVEPIIWNKRTGYVVGGNQRLRAMIELGKETEAEVVVVDIDETKEKALNIALNKINGEWDDDKIDELILEIESKDAALLALTGFDDSEISQILNKDANEDEFDEEAAARNPKYIVNPGEIWKLGRHRLMCGDATKKEDMEKLMDGKKADMVFTDPPYGVSYAGKNEFLNNMDKGNRIQTEIINDQKTVDELADSVIYPAFCNIKEVLARKGSYYITAPQGGELLMMMMMMMMKAGLTLRHMLIWVKNNHVLGRTDYNYKHEPILYGWIDGHNFYGGGALRFSTWEIDKPHKNDLHPTMKPIALMTNALLNSSLRDNIILDSFGGSGSTLIACEQLNRVCHMMEIDPIYVSVIIERFETLTGNKAERVSDGDVNTGA